MGALANRDPSDRIRIANLLMDEGADASVVANTDHVNVLHVLVSGLAEGHDFEAEAVLLERLLDGGADINLQSARFGYPIECLSTMAASADRCPSVGW